MNDVLLRKVNELLMALVAEAYAGKRITAVQTASIAVVMDWLLSKAANALEAEMKADQKLPPESIN